MAVYTARKLRCIDIQESLNFQPNHLQFTPVYKKAFKVFSYNDFCILIIENCKKNITTKNLFFKN